MFSNFGTIESVRILTHKTCGFVNFYSPDDAARAKRTLHNKEIMGTATGLVRIGYAKVPALKPSATTPTFRAATPPMDVLLEEDATAELVIEQQQPMYMMADTASDQSLFSSAASERQFIMQEFGQDESDGPMFDGKDCCFLIAKHGLTQLIIIIILFLGIYAPPQYFNAIPAAPELGQSRKVDIYRLRDVRKRLDTGHVSTKELESVAMECLDELVELCSG